MALTDDFALYALGVAAQESHPSLIEGRCLNHVQFKMTCDCCTEACPAGVAIHQGRIDWSACTNCNLCVTACPTGALAESASLTRTLAAVRATVGKPGRRFADALAADGAGNGADNGTDARQIIVACMRHNGPADVRLACIASLSWEFAAVFALEGTLVLKTSPCRECPDADCKARVRDLISTLRRFFGPDEFARRIMPKAPAQAASTRSAAGDAPVLSARKQAGTARRAALESATGMAKSAAARLTDQGGSTVSEHCSDRRSILLDAIAATPVDARVPLHWSSLAVDGNCRGCTVCERICPNHAIRIRLTGQKSRNAAEPAADAAAATAEPGSTEPANAFIHDASLCTQCGLCYMSCPEQAISDWDVFSSITVPATRTTPIDVAFCEKCGKPFKPKAGAARCPACSRFRFA